MMLGLGQTNSSVGAYPPWFWMTPWPERPSSNVDMWTEAENHIPTVMADLAIVKRDPQEGIWDTRGMNGMGAPWMPYAAGMGQAGTILPDPVAIPNVQELQKWVQAHPKVQKALANHPGLRRAFKTRAFIRGVRGLGQACDPNCISPTTGIVNDANGTPCCTSAQTTTQAVPSTVPSSALGYTFTDATGVVWNCSASGICAPNYSATSSASSTSTSLIPGVSNTVLLLGVAAVAAFAFLGKGN